MHASVRKTLLLYDFLYNPLFNHSPCESKRIQVYNLQSFNDFQNHLCTCNLLWISVAPKLERKNKQGNSLNTKSSVKHFPKYSKKCREMCNRKSSTLRQLQIEKFFFSLLCNLLSEIVTGMTSRYFLFL